MTKIHLVIRQVTYDDLQSLDHYLPPEDPVFGHRQRMADQDAGDVGYMAAWSGDVPVGSKEQGFCEEVLVDHGYSLMRGETFAFPQTISGTPAWSKSYGRRNIVESVNAGVKGGFTNIDRDYIRSLKTVCTGIKMLLKR